MLLKTSAYVKSYDENTKWMYFLIEDKDLSEKYSTIWDKVSADIKKEFDSERVSNNFFENLMTMKLHIFTIKTIPKADSNYTSLAVISFNFVLKKDERFYLQVFLKERKYIKKIVFIYIDGNLSDFSSSEIF